MSQVSGSTNLADMSATALLRLYAGRQASPVEATRAALDRAASIGEAVNAFRFVAGDAALEAARQAEARWVRGEPRGLLDGVPATIKDTHATAGWPTLFGSQTIDPDRDWPEDAPIVARLRGVGAVILGKTTTPEYGWKGVTDSPLTGITRNPWDTRVTPGGSSGGAAAACALGMGALHTGSDAGGSIRIPAGFTGVFGIKPSYGRVPAHPPSAFLTLSHPGPLTRTVADAALMLTAIAGPDARDAYALPFDNRDYRVGLEDGVRGLRIAYSRDFGYVEVDPEIARLTDAAAARFTELGATVEAVDPGFESPRKIFRTLWHSAAALLVRGIDASRHAAMDKGLLAIAEDGARFDARDFVAAELARMALIASMNRFHQTYDLLLSPMLPIPAFPAGQDVADPAKQREWYDWTPFTYPFNLTQQPAASVPCGLTPGGLPAGLQIVGPRYADALVLQAARAFESLAPFAMPDPGKLSQQPVGA